MSGHFRKKIIGVLGGIGAGKSSVAEEFSKLGCKVIDADSIAGEFLCLGEVRDEVFGVFGEGILGEDGSIDRRKLGDAAFADGEKLTQLNNILHPRTLGRIEALICEYNAEPDIRAIVLDIPLLVEVGWAKRCDILVFVACRDEVRAARIKKKGRFDKKSVKKREKFQISLDIKAGMADNAVDNNSDFLALSEQVAEIFSHIVDTV